MVTTCVMHGMHEIVVAQRRLFGKCTFPSDDDLKSVGSMINSNAPRMCDILTNVDKNEASIT